MDVSSRLAVNLIEFSWFFFFSLPPAGMVIMTGVTGATGTNENGSDVT